MNVPHLSQGVATVSPAEPASAQAVAQSGTAMGWLDAIQADPDRIVAVALLALSLATLVSVATAFYLYRWRRIILAKPYLLSPEHLAEQILALEKRLDDSERAHAATASRLEASNDEVRAALERMIQTYMALQPKLDERDREIQRLRAGLEASMFRKFVRRFVRADLGISERINRGVTGREALESIGVLLEDALAECGIERFSPSTGIDYRRAEGVADNPELIATDDPEKAFVIAEVRRRGYRFTEGDGDRVVMPAEVTVYEFRDTRAKQSEGDS